MICPATAPTTLGPTGSPLVLLDPGRARRSREEPGGARRSQEDPEESGGSRRSQEEPGRPRRSQGEPEGDRGGARMSQEEPVGPRQGLNKWPAGLGSYTVLFDYCLCQFAYETEASAS